MIHIYAKFIHCLQGKHIGGSEWILHKIYYTYLNAPKLVDAVECFQTGL